MKNFAALALVSLVGCAHPYTLDAMGEKPEVMNGIALSSVAAQNCVLQAGYQYSNPYEMLVKVRVTNKEKAALEIDPTSFAMNGPSETIKSSPLMASDPDKYLRDLTTTAESLEARTQMESFQGVEDLGELKGENADKTIDDAKKAFRGKQKEAQEAREQADAIRKRIAIIQPTTLKKQTIKTGETAEGALIFKAAFGETGVVTIESTSAACPAKLQFMLKK